MQIDWDHGCGRFAYNAGTLFIGGWPFKRESYGTVPQIRQAVLALDPPPSTAECLWLIRYVLGAEFLVEQVLTLLAEAAAKTAE